jgi:glycosyltransferase involved in cell wall biosynthesis
MVVHAYYPVGETRVQRQAAALRAAGFDVDVICLKGDGEARTDVVDGVSVRRLPVGRHRGSGMLVQLVEYLVFLILAATIVGWRHLRDRYHTVQVHNLPDALVFSAIVPKLTGTPVILDVHDLMPEFFRARTGLGPRHPLVRLVSWEERLSVRFADHVITVTEGWRKTLVARCGIADVSVVMNLADPTMFRPRGAMVESDVFSIVYHGTFTERYGVLLLVRAVEQLSRSVDGVRLQLLGDGDIRPELERLTHALGVESFVTLSDGMLETEAVVPVIESASVGVVPNLSNVFTDGLLPTKLLEYVAVGVPVVAARTPMIAEYFSDEQIAFFEPGDEAGLATALAKLHADTDLRDSLARAASAFNRIHNWPAESARYVELVSRLGSSPSP